MALPLALYAYRFGFGLWESHSRWGEFGSFMGGVYAPILTILTLAILSVQIYLQALQHRESLAVNQENLLLDYIRDLESVLNLEFEDGITYRIYLSELFLDKDREEIAAMDPETVFNLNQRNHKLYSMWCGVIGCLSSLKRYSNMWGQATGNYAVQKNRVISYIDPQCCRCLDKYNYAFISACKEQGVNSKVELGVYEFWNYSAGK